MSEVVYLHVPKTGGTYVARNDDVISPINDLNHSAFVHKPFNAEVKNYPPNPGYNNSMAKDISIVKKLDRICFATVRNPYSWLVSWWFHSGCNILESEKPTHPDYKLARRGFKPFVEAIANRDTGWPCKKLIHFAFFAYEGNLVVDRLVHQEFLDVELEQLAKDYDLKYQKRDRVMVSKEAKPYWEYYDKELATLVRDTWKRELSLFGYGFMWDTGDGILHKIVSKEQQQSIKYYWEDDLLTVDGKEFRG